MSIATKNGSIIVKNGSIAENCGCCGGWYCCASDCSLASPSSVEVTIVAEDYYTQDGMSDNMMPGMGTGIVNYESSACVFGSAVSGTHSLTKVETEPLYASTWKKTFAPMPNGCNPTELTVNLQHNSLMVPDFSYELSVPAFFFASPVSGVFCGKSEWQSRIISPSQMSCGMPLTDLYCVGGANFGWLWESAYFSTLAVFDSGFFPECPTFPFTTSKNFHYDSPSGGGRFIYAKRSLGSSYGTTIISNRQISGSPLLSLSVVVS